LAWPSELMFTQRSGETCSAIIQYAIGTIIDELLSIEYCCNYHYSSYENTLGHTFWPLSMKYFPTKPKINRYIFVKFVYFIHYVFNVMHDLYFLKSHTCNIFMSY
jgi:hypothetical protein